MWCLPALTTQITPHIFFNYHQLVTALCRITLLCLRKGHKLSGPIRKEKKKLSLAQNPGIKYNNSGEKHLKGIKIFSTATCSIKPKYIGSMLTLLQELWCGKCTQFNCTSGFTMLFFPLTGLFYTSHFSWTALSRLNGITISFTTLLAPLLIKFSYIHTHSFV